MGFENDNEEIFMVDILLFLILVVLLIGIIWIGVTLNQMAETLTRTKQALFLEMVELNKTCKSIKSNGVTRLKESREGKEK